MELRSLTMYWYIAHSTVNQDSNLKSRDEGLGCLVFTAQDIINHPTNKIYNTNVLRSVLFYVCLTLRIVFF
jgi:hypothetical protein